MLKRVLFVVAIVALAASACGGSEFDETVLDSVDADRAGSDAQDSASSVDGVEVSGLEETADEVDGDTSEGVQSAEPAPASCADHEFVAIGFDPIPTDTWCSDNHAFASIDVLGGNSIGYAVARGQWTPVRMSEVPQNLDLGYLIDAGVSVDEVGEICEKLVGAVLLEAEGCDASANPGATAIVAVQLLLEGRDVAAYGSLEGIAALAAVVPATEGGTASFNRQVSFAAGGSVDGCWLVGDVALDCAIDLRDGDGHVFSTINVDVFPEGVTGAGFEGFTGTWLIETAGEQIDPLPVASTLSIYGLSGFEDEPTLRDLLQRFGGEADVTDSAPVLGSCFRAAGRGFPGIQFLVEGADSGDPLDGAVKGYWATSLDYATPSGLRPAMQRADVTTALGLQLERVDGSGLAGYWLDFRAEDPTEQDITVRFYIGINDRVRAVGAGARDWVGSSECGHLEPTG